MRRYQLPACCAAIAALSTAPAHAQDVPAAVPGWIQEKPLVQPINPLPHWYEVRGGQWQVPIETLRELALLMQAKLADNDKFNRKNGRTRHAIQFRGEVIDGVRIIRLVGACNGESGERASLSAQFRDIMDGGRCVFDARYSPLEKRLSFFEYHGYA